MSCKRFLKGRTVLRVEEDYNSILLHLDNGTIFTISVEEEVNDLDPWEWGVTHLKWCSETVESHLDKKKLFEENMKKLEGKIVRKVGTHRVELADLFDRELVKRPVDKK